MTDKNKLGLILTGLETLFLALSDKTRLRLLSLMANGEVPVGFLADELGESQPKISRHLAYLRNAGLVSTRRDGKWVYYGIEPQVDRGVADVLDAALSALVSEYVVRDFSVTRTVEESPQSDYHREELPVYLL